MKQVLLRLLNSYTVGFQSTPAGTIAQLIQGFQSYLINPEYSPSSAQSVGEGQGGIEGGVALDLSHAIYCVNHDEPLNSVVNMCDKSMKIIDITLNSDRMITFRIHNTALLEGKEAIQCVFHHLTTNDVFINFSDTKIIFMIAEYDDCERSYHKNVLITNDTTFDQYWAEIKNYVNDKYLSGSTSYAQSVVKVYKVIVWDVHHLRNKNIKIHRSNNGEISSQVTPKGPAGTASFFLLNPTGMRGGGGTHGDRGSGTP